MNAFGAHAITGGENFAARSSRSAIEASDGSPVEFETTHVDVTLPYTSTPASTTTMPCAELSENAGFGGVTNEKSESGRQPRRGRAAAPSRTTCCDETQPTTPSASRTRS